jgi:hypothetical protein
VNVLSLLVVLLTSMPVLDMAGLDTQTAPMDAIAEVLNDYHGGFTNAVETVALVNAITTEWRY